MRPQGPVPLAKSARPMSRGRPPRSSLPHGRRAESFADDLNTRRGIVSGRVALLPRSTEIQPHVARIRPSPTPPFRRYRFRTHAPPPFFLTSPQHLPCRDHKTRGKDGGNLLTIRGAPGQIYMHPRQQNPIIGLPGPLSPQTMIARARGGGLIVVQVGYAIRWQGLPATCTA